MAEFEKAFYVVMGNEGGYSNHPADKGGETFAGISRNNFPLWEGWKILDKSKDKTSTLLLIGYVKDFYKKEFWDKMQLDSCTSNKMSIELFDTAVNMGIKVAGTMLQRVLNVINVDSHGRELYPKIGLDGIIGHNTIQTFNTLDDAHEDMAYKLFNCIQGYRYISICENNPSQKIFMMGWVKRI